MKRYRIGNDISIIWTVKSGIPSFSLDGKTVKLFMTHPKGREELDGFSINGNTISYTFAGLDQKVLGRYTLTIDARYATGSRYLIQDKCGAFELVGRSCAECEEPDITTYTLSL